MQSEFEIDCIRMSRLSNLSQNKLSQDKLLRIKMLIDSKFCFYFSTALIMACIGEDAKREFVEFLVSEGADVSIQNNKGE